MRVKILLITCFSANVSPYYFKQNTNQGNQALSRDTKACHGEKTAKKFVNFFFGET